MKRVEEQWLSYECRVMPVDAGATQRLETRRAFYAGAWALYTKLLVSLDAPGHEPTDADMVMMNEIDRELRDFNEEVKAGRA